MDTTFKWGDATLSLHSMTVRDRNSKQIIQDLILERVVQGGENIPLQISYNVVRFAEFVVCARVTDGDFPFVIPGVSASVDDLIAAYQAYGDLPGEFIDVYDAARVVLHTMGNGAARQTVEKKDEPQS